MTWLRSVVQLSPYKVDPKDRNCIRLSDLDKRWEPAAFDLIKSLTNNIKNLKTSFHEEDYITFVFLQWTGFPFFTLESAYNLITYFPEHYFVIFMNIHKNLPEQTVAKYVKRKPFISTSWSYQLSVCKIS